MLHQRSDSFSGYLIAAMLVFSPWAFGTTQPWSIWVMNSLGYGLGFLLMVKLLIRRWTRYENPRWDRLEQEGGRSTCNRHRARVLSRSLALVTGLLLAYCLISAINARATYLPGTVSFAYLSHVVWLPHSYDAASSWRAFWSYLAIGLSFWGVRDWLLGKTVSEQLAERGKLAGGAEREMAFLPERMRFLLWVLCLNGGLLAVEGIIQRLADAGELLFLVRPRIHQLAVEQFGPYAYRANAAQYFNLAWPAALGLWWMLVRAKQKGLSGQGGKRHHLVLGCVVLMALCPLLSASRVGAAVAVMNLVAAAGIIWSGQRKQDKRAKAWIALVTLAVIVGGLGLAGDSLFSRLSSSRVERGFEIRNSTYELAGPMAEENPLFGTGPGTFETLFQMFRHAPEEYWPAQLHNDWLETLITFGLAGSALVLAGLGLVLARWFVPGGIHGGRRMVFLLWVSLGGCLAHARYDFPFQIYSILFLFVVLCAILFTLSRQASK